MLLEAVAAENESSEYETAFYEDGELAVFDWRPMVRQIASGGEAAEKVAAKFMNTLVRMAAEMCRRAAEKTGLRRIVLSGGVFQNMYLMERLPGAMPGPAAWRYTRTAGSRRTTRASRSGSSWLWRQNMCLAVPLR